MIFNYLHRNGFKHIPQASLADKFKHKNMFLQICWLDKETRKDGQPFIIITQDKLEYNYKFNQPYEIIDIVKSECEKMEIMEKRERVVV